MVNEVCTILSSVSTILSISVFLFFVDLSSIASSPLLKRRHPLDLRTKTLPIDLDLDVSTLKDEGDL